MCRDVWTRCIGDLTEADRINPSRCVEAMRQRLSEQVARLLAQSQSFDRQRLHQEATLLATGAYIQEELDCLASYIGDSAIPVPQLKRPRR